MEYCGKSSEPPVVFEAIAAVLRKTYGFCLPPTRYGKSLEMALDEAANAVGCSRSQFINRLLAADSDSIQLLIESCVIGETYFSRQPAHFTTLVERVLPSFKDLPEIVIWSAGCSTGEEAYRLAMAALDSHGCERIKVIGTDVSQRFLAKARTGVYSSWSLRELEPGIQRWLAPSAGVGVQVAKEARLRVEFIRHNLALDPAPVAECPVIFCRNVLIYFDRAAISAILQKLYRALRPGGYLFLGGAELLAAMHLGFEWVDCGKVTVLRRPETESALLRSLPKRNPSASRLPLSSRGAKRWTPAAERAAHQAQAATAAPSTLAAEPAAAVDAAGQLQRAWASLRCGDFKEAERLAHALVGSSGLSVCDSELIYSMGALYLPKRA